MAEEMQGASRNWEFHGQAPKLLSFGQKKGFPTAVSQHGPSELLPAQALWLLLQTHQLKGWSQSLLRLRWGGGVKVLYMPLTISQAPEQPSPVPWALLAVCLELEQSHGPGPALCSDSRAALQIRAVRPPALCAELLSGAFCSHRLLAD